MSEQTRITPEQQARLRALAEKVTDSLFTNGADERADRLVLWQEASSRTGYNLGGWSRGPVVDRIYEAMLAALQAGE